MNKKQKKTSNFEVSSDNIFRDIGIENPEEELTKANLAWEINQIITKRNLTQKEAATIMGINQPKVSALLRRKLSGFSVERLLHFLNQLGQDIDIIVKPKPKNRENARVLVMCFDTPIKTGQHARVNL